MSIYRVNNILIIRILWCFIPRCLHHPDGRVSRRSELWVAARPVFFIIDIIYDRAYDQAILGKENNSMPTLAGITMMKMIESLPEPVQERALEHMQQYIEDIQDELKWSDSFGSSQSKLIAAARQAREEIKRGKSAPMNFEDL